MNNSHAKSRIFLTLLMAALIWQITGIKSLNLCPNIAAATLDSTTVKNKETTTGIPGRKNWTDPGIKI